MDFVQDEIVAKRQADREVYLANRAFLHAKGFRHGSVNRHVVHKEKRLTKERGEGDKKPTLRLILRTDVDGTLEAIQNVLDTYDFSEVDLQVVDASVGPPYEALVEIAEEFKCLILYAMNITRLFSACIYCFNVPVSATIKELAASKGVEIEQFNIIYKLVDALKLRLDTTYGPITNLELEGEGHVLKEFMISGLDRKRTPIAGTLVDWGVLTR